MEFKCSLCNYQSSVKANIRKHINNKTKCGEGILNIIEIPVEIICEHCNKEFTTLPSMKRHIKTCKIKKNNLEKEVKDLEEKLEEANRKLASKTIIMKLEETNKKLTTENKKLKEMVITKAQIRTESRKLYKKNYKLICVHCKNNNEKNIQICHIKPVSEFTLDNLSEVNKMSNLIALCANCHLDLDVSKKDDVVRTARLHKFIVNHCESISNYAVNKP